ncbi:hypothetical protein ACOMHN_042385 [Nucella lapillus]
MKLSKRKIPDPSSQKLNWLKTPLSALVIKKPYDPNVTSAFRDLVVWLVQVGACQYLCLCVCMLVIKKPYDPQRHLGIRDLVVWLVQVCACQYLCLCVCMLVIKKPYDPRHLGIRDLVVWLVQVGACQYLCLCVCMLVIKKPYDPQRHLGIRDLVVWLVQVGACQYLCLCVCMLVIKKPYDPQRHLGIRDLVVWLVQVGACQYLCLCVCMLVIKKPYDPQRHLGIRDLVVWLVQVGACQYLCLCVCMLVIKKPYDPQRHLGIRDLVVWLVQVGACQYLCLCVCMLVIKKPYDPQRHLGLQGPGCLAGTGRCLSVPVSVCMYAGSSKSPMTHNVTSAFWDLVVWLVQEKQLRVYVEEKVVKDEALTRDPEFTTVNDGIHKFKEGVDDLEDKVDFIICLGGDGTLLYASSLFQQSVPPVIAFNMGSLGFLTPFPVCSFKERINHVLKGQVPLSLRYRLKCVLQKPGSSEKTTMPLPQLKHMDRTSQHVSTHILVLNEVVIDRGPSPYLCNLDLFIEGHLVTSVLGDGLIISTPTGSTAYSVAAGASMIHPNVPCILLTPICPHSLSFRPIVLPAGVEVKVCFLGKMWVMLAPEARGTAMVSFDGRNRQQIQQGTSLRITTASYPVPSICAQGQIEDWFSGLADCLHWNVRKIQKSLSPSLSMTSLDSVDLEAGSK